MSKMHSQELILAMRFMFNKKSFVLVGKMALQMKVLAIRADNSSSALRTHVVEGQNRLPQLSSALHKSRMVSAHTHKRL